MFGNAKRLYFTLLITLFLSGYTFDFGYAFQGTQDESEIKIFNLNESSFFNLSDSYYNESWIYSFSLNDSIQMTYSFNVSEIGTFKNRVTGAKMLLSFNENDRFELSKEYSLNSFEFNNDSIFIKLHPERSFWVTAQQNGSQTIRLETRKNDVNYNIEFELFNMAESVRWKEGLFEIGSENFFMELLVPHAQVKGYISVNDDSVQVKGTASMIHTYLTGKSNKLLDEGIRYTILDYNSANDYLISYLLKTKKNNWIGYGISKEEDKISVLIPEELSILSEKKLRGVKVIESAEIKYHYNEIHSLKVEKILDHYSYLDELNGFSKMLVKSFLGSEIVEFQAMGTLNDSKQISFENFFTKN